MKPRKQDFANGHDFLHASAAWAAVNMNEWPWGGPKNDDDNYCYVAAQNEVANEPSPLNIEPKPDPFD